MQKLGKYVVTRKLGAGGMGVVYEARDPDLDRPVAIKLLHDNGDPERFKREAKLAARVGHPNCVIIHDRGEHDGGFYVVMELVDGENASQWLARRGPLPWQMVTKLLIAAGRGLAAVHDAGLIHRDVKPSNILISKAGAVKLTDFGLARSVAKDGPSLTGDRVVGTPHYMSPEQCWNEPVDARSDIYSLGATYFVLLTGRTPYSAAHDLQVMFAHCNDPVPEPRALRPELPEVCANIARRAMAKAPAERYQTARELVAALEAVLAADPNPPAPDTATPDISLDVDPTPVPNDPTCTATPQSRPSPRHTRRAALAAVPLLVAGGIGGYFLWRNTRPGGANGHAGGDPPAVLIPERSVGGFVGAVAVSDSGRWLAVGLAEARQVPTVSIFGLKPKEVFGVKLFDRAAGDAPAVWRQWLDADCRGVAFTPDGSLLAAAGGRTGRLLTWSLAEQQSVEFPQAALGAHVAAVAVSADGKLLAAGVHPPDESQAFVRVWDALARTFLRDVTLRQPVRSLAFAADGKTLAVGLTRSARENVPSVELWDATGGGKLDTLGVVQAVTGPRVACARAKPLLAVANIDGVDFYDLPRLGVHSRRFAPAGAGEPGAVALAPDGATAAVALGDDIYLWDIAAGAGGVPLASHTAGVNALAFTADGKTLISGSDERTVREWSGF